jgi:hypothetical protein
MLKNIEKDLGTVPMNQLMRRTEGEIEKATEEGIFPIPQDFMTEVMIDRIISTMKSDTPRIFQGVERYIELVSNESRTLDIKYLLQHFPDSWEETQEILKTKILNIPAEELINICNRLPSSSQSDFLLSLLLLVNNSNNNEKDNLKAVETTTPISPGREDLFTNQTDYDNVINILDTDTEIEDPKDTNSLNEPDQYYHIRDLVHLINSKLERDYPNEGSIFPPKGLEDELILLQELLCNMKRTLIRYIKGSDESQDSELRPQMFSILKEKNPDLVTNLEEFAVYAANILKSPEIDVQYILWNMNSDFPKRLIDEVMTAKISEVTKNLANQEDLYKKLLLTMKEKIEANFNSGSEGTFTDKFWGPINEAVKNPDNRKVLHDEFEEFISPIIDELNSKRKIPEHNDFPSLSSFFVESLPKRMDEDVD